MGISETAKTTSTKMASLEEQTGTIERANTLNIASTETITAEMCLDAEEAPKTAADIDPEVAAKAQGMVDQLFSTDIEAQAKRDFIDTMGLKTQENAAHRSGMLKAPIKELMKTGGEGGPVAESLMALNEQVTDLDPTGLNIVGAKKLLGKIPFVGSPLKKYFAKYQSAEAIIDEIIKSLEMGRDQLKRDNKTLGFDQQKMREATDALKDAIKIGMAMDVQMGDKLATDIDPSDTEQVNFVQEELLFPLRQRIMDLQQTLAVNQQGIMTTEIIIRNNRELIRGVSRALNVTVTALQTAIAYALALAHQKIVLDKITALNATTSNIIEATARQLKTTGVEIHKQAASTALSMESLENAFADIKEAMEDISRFRREALPQMAQNIQRLDVLSEESTKVITKMDRGRAASDQVQLGAE